MTLTERIIQRLRRSAPVGAGYRSAATVTMADEARDAIRDIEARIAADALRIRQLEAALEAREIILPAAVTAREIAEAADVLDGLGRLDAPRKNTVELRSLACALRSLLEVSDGIDP